MRRGNSPETESTVYHGTDRQDVESAKPEPALDINESNTRDESCGSGRDYMNYEDCGNGTENRKGGLFARIRAKLIAKWTNRYLPAEPGKVKRYRVTLLASLVLFVFSILLTSTLFVASLFLLLSRVGIIPIEGATPLHYTIIILFIFSIAVGTSLTAMFGNMPLRPFREMIRATRQIASGNFDVRVPIRGPEELKNLAHSFNLMAEDLKGIETLRSDFVSNVSHEFKTPVASINGFAKLLKKNNLSEETRSEYLDIIIRESERLSRLSGNVLLLSKLESLDHLVDQTPYSLDEQLRRTILILQPEWQRKGIHLNLDLDYLVICGSQEMLQQVWLNLIGNAIKCSEQNGEITVTLSIRTPSPTRSIAVVTVVDKGIGMSDEIIRHLFDKFYQGDPSHSSEGNGLGLALVKRIVELSGGKVSVKSTLGEGSSFTVELPL